VNEPDWVAESAEEAQRLEGRIGDLAAVHDADVIARALANALVIAVQEYLERHSSQDDLELFFEVHGSPPSEIGPWPVKIIADLRRHRIPPADRAKICEQAVAAAVGFVQTRSPLAWGNPARS
jgi:hypothetical protein